MTRKLDAQPSRDGAQSIGAPNASGYYMPPFGQILAALGITHFDLQSDTVTVSSRGLVHLLEEALRHVGVDEAWYIERYPDVHAAIIAGDTESAAKHFRLAGYREGRHPRLLPFDATYYFEQYSDLAGAFDPTDVEGLRHHFETRGYYEGRAGLPKHFSDAERWRAVAEGRS